MKKILQTLLFVSICLNGYSKTWIISNSGYTFSPASITIDEGDDINFTLESMHNAAEVSQAVWDSNGNSPIIGFSLPFGGGMLSSSFLTVGTHYYVCTPHAFLQMKGIIIVQPLSGLKENKTQNEILIYPNPVKDFLNIQCNSSESNMLEIKLFNIAGSLVKVLMTRTQVEMPFLKSFDLSEEIKSGVYILQITEGDKASYRKVIVL